MSRGTRELEARRIGSCYSPLNAGYSAKRSWSFMSAGESTDGMLVVVRSPARLEGCWTVPMPSCCLPG